HRTSGRAEGGRRGCEGCGPAARRSGLAGQSPGEAASDRNRRTTADRIQPRRTTVQRRHGPAAQGGMMPEYLIHKAVDLSKVLKARKAVLSQPGYLDREYL